MQYALNEYLCMHIRVPIHGSYDFDNGQLFTLVAYDSNFQTELWFGAREDASWCCDGSGRTGVWYAVSAGRFRWVQVCKEWRTAVKHCTNEWMIIFFIPLLWRRRGHTVLALCVCLFVVLFVCLSVSNKKFWSIFLSNHLSLMLQILHTICLCMQYVRIYFCTIRTSTTC